MQTRTLLKSLAIVGAVSLFVATEAAALSATFFGEDPAPGGVVAPGGNAATQRQMFLDALTGGFTVEDFESFATGGPANVPIPSIGGTLTGPALIIDGTAGDNFGMFPTSPDNYLRVPGSFDLTFGAPVVAFGFFATDVGDHGGSLSIAIDGGTPIEINHSEIAGGSTDHNLIFWGIIDTDNPFTTIAFSNAIADNIGLDDLTVGDVLQTPLPAALPLLLTALSALGLLGWRRRRAVA